MAVHCSSNVILLAIEYFIDSKGERQNIKLLSTQNNYSPSFGLKKLVIFFISSDKTDKKLCRSWKCKTRCRTKQRSGQGMAFDQGASRPQGAITANSTGAPQNAWHLKLKKIQRIQRNIDRKKTCFQSFFLNFNYFSFQRKKWGRGPKKVVGLRPYQPLPLRGPCIPVQKYKFQYKNQSFGTEKFVPRNWKKTVGTSYDYYYVTKYMLIIVYLNKPFIFHYYKFSRLYSTKNHHTHLYNTIQPHTSASNTMHIYTSPYTSLHNHTPVYKTLHLYTSPCTSIHHHTSMYNTIHSYTKPYTPIHHHTPIYITLHPCITPYTPLHHHTFMYKTMHPYT